MRTVSSTLPLTLTPTRTLIRTLTLTPTFTFRRILARTPTPTPCSPLRANPGTRCAAGGKTREFWNARENPRIWIPGHGAQKLR